MNHPRDYALVGLPGSGKTSIASAIESLNDENTTIFYEITEIRKFHEACKNNPYKYSFLNQLDFFMEKAAWESYKPTHTCGKIRIFDTCIDLDYFVYTYEFADKGWLSQGELEALTATFNEFRKKFYGPDIILITAHADDRKQRIANRNRQNDIATDKNMPTIEVHFDKFAAEMKSRTVLTINTSHEYTSPLSAANHIIDFITLREASHDN